ncbi:MAG: tRNA preQ1(34) S-adenosylmethionine ribosyltransferase-isomerase QueA [Pseudomonadota bacterium]
MDLASYDFDLPDHLIALRPLADRTAARLLVVHGDGRLEDCRIGDLPDLLQPTDVLVFNDTRVIPAALSGVRPKRDETGEDVAVDLNLVEQLSGEEWRALGRPGRRLRPGDRIELAPGFSATILEKEEGGRLKVSFSVSDGTVEAAIERHGAMPLPPYIARRRPADARDRADYQTTYAGDDAGSFAAPTAGLHFTDVLLSRLSEKSIQTERVTLHVGLGTFSPLTDEELASRRLHAEWRTITPSTTDRLNQAAAQGRRIIPVGTTAMRTLESAVTGQSTIKAVTGPTDIFIQPGDKIGFTGGLMTNFHLPRSSLFMLVCALMGTEIMQAAYAHATATGYRFYSYGDACLLLP